MDRREFLKVTAAGAAVLAIPGAAGASSGLKMRTVERVRGFKMMKDGGHSYTSRTFFEKGEIPHHSESFRELHPSVNGSRHLIWERVNFIDLKEADVFRMFNLDGTPHYDDVPWDQKIYHWRADTDAVMTNGVPGCQATELFTTGKEQDPSASPWYFEIFE